MKYLKMLGLAAVAALALMAFAGAGSATASTLCKTKVEPGQKCPTEWRWGKPLNLKASLAKESSTELLAGSLLETCTESSITAEMTNEGSETENVAGEVKAEGLTWGGCTNATKTTEGGTIEIEANAETEANGNGKVKTKGFKWTIFTFGVTCLYGGGNGITLGTYTEETKHIDVNTTVLRQSGSSFICPATVTWRAAYVITEPAGTIWVATK